jgi:hypothetical protein
MPMLARHRDYVLRQPRGGGRRSLASVQNAMAELMEGSGIAPLRWKVLQQIS